MKLNYRKTFLIGLAFFSASMVWPIYNTFVPILLDRFIQSAFWIGFIMSFDNIFGVVFQPLFGALSDRTNTRYGRRMPYLLVGVPLAALFFSLIPIANSLFPLMLFIIITVFSMSIYRAPAVALMPDVTPSPLRSKANGIINFMGGAAAAIGYGVGGILYEQNQGYPFYLGSIIMVAALIILYLFFKEPEITEAPDRQEEKGPETREEARGRLMSLIFILLAIFFWFTGFNAVETFFSLYCSKVLAIEPGLASRMLFLFTGAFVIFAIPAGFVASRFGRRNTILTGLAGLLLLFIALNFLKDLLIIRILLVLGGIFWASVNINSYPMVVEMASSKGIGAYTGYYYFFSFSAAIISPILFGWIADQAGSYRPLFVYASIAFLLAFFFMMLVKHGDVSPAGKNPSEIPEQGNP